MIITIGYSTQNQETIHPRLLTWTGECFNTISVSGDVK